MNQGTRRKDTGNMSSTDSLSFNNNAAAAADRRDNTRPPLAPARLGLHAGINAASFAQNSSHHYASSSAGHEPFRNSDRASADAAPRYRGEPREASPLQPPFGHAASTAHKRTASGNPRLTSRATGPVPSMPSIPSMDGTSVNGGKTEERERRTERRSERTVITSRDVLVSRSRASPDRRSQSSRTATARDKTGAEARKPSAPAAATAAATATAPAVAVPWKPEVTLLPHTSAPLASRISIPPLASLVPASLKPEPLSDLSLEVQEAVMIEDLLCVFMGCEGQYIRFGKGYDPNEERDRLSGPPWRILPGLDPSLQDLTASMLRTATHYAALEAFVDVQSREQYGLVCQALCATVRRLLQDYLVLIAQLETQFLTDDGFTLHVLNIHMLPTSQMMLQLYTLAHELLKENGLLDDDDDDDGGSSSNDDDSVEDYDKIVERLREGGELLPGHAARPKICKGGAVLGLITRRLEALSGDPAARALLTALLRDASRPYMAMLNEWLHHGAISDPHAEFLVKERKSIRREKLEEDYTDEYWDGRYTLRDKEVVPPQLGAAAVTDKVLLAGKYLNVVRECGGVDMSKQVVDVPTSFDDKRFLDNIHTAYAHANASLMQLLLTTHALPARLRSLKHYFFLDPSDYFAHFLELSHNELRKRNLRAVNTSKLQSLLDLVLRQPGSVVSLDPFKEDVKVEMNDTTLVQALQKVVNIKGIDREGSGSGEALSLLQGADASTAAASSSSSADADGYASLQLDYVVPFPVSLVVGRKTIWRYQALFRFLLSLHHLEAQLSTTWQTHMRELPWFHRSSSRSVAVWKRRLFTLRARMLVFVQQLLYFCTAEVIEPNWQALMSRLQAPGGGEAGQQKTAAVLSLPSESTDDGRAPAAAPAMALPNRTVDELMQDHVDFLDTCLKECMLTNGKLLKIHAKLMQTCFSFVNFVSYLTRNMDKIDADLAGPTQPKDATAAQWRAFQQQAKAARQQQADASTGAAGGDDAAEMRSLVDKLAKYEHSFGRNLQVLLDALNHYAATETVVLLSLCARLSTANQGTEYAGLRHDEDLV